MKYYKVKSSHWPMELEFKSVHELKEGQCFRILEHNGSRSYPTRFKVLSVFDTPKFDGTIVEMLSIDTNVESFE